MRNTGTNRVGSLADGTPAALGAIVRGGRGGRGVPMAKLPRRRRQRRRIITGIVVALLALLLVLDRHMGPIRHGDELRRYDGRRFEVVRVINGHTLDVAEPNGDATVTRVRLWGVALPEGERRAAWAQTAAAARVEELVMGERVRLELESHRMRGDFGRVLAFVHLPEPEGTMLNETLLIEGLMRADDRWSHRHAERFALFERQARFERRGIWADTLE